MDGVEPEKGAAACDQRPQTDAGATSPSLGGMSSFTHDAARTSGGTHLEAISGLGMRIEHGLLGQTQLLVDTARPITWTIGNGR